MNLNKLLHSAINIVTFTSIVVVLIIIQTFENLFGWSKNL